MKSPRRSEDEQYALIMECRSSGLSDQQWCIQHDINPGTVGIIGNSKHFS